MRRESIRHATASRADVEQTRCNGWNEISIWFHRPASKRASAALEALNMRQNGNYWSGYYTGNEEADRVYAAAAAVIGA